eukprot:354873-Chlamydomonas_euryale.AAC.9
MSSQAWRGRVASYKDAPGSRRGFREAKARLLAYHWLWHPNKVGSCNRSDQHRESQDFAGRHAMQRCHDGMRCGGHAGEAALRRARHSKCTAETRESFDLHHGASGAGRLSHLELRRGSDIHTHTYRGFGVEAVRCTAATLPPKLSFIMAAPLPRTVAVAHIHTRHTSTLGTQWTSRHRCRRLVSGCTPAGRASDTPPPCGQASEFLADACTDDCQTTTARPRTCVDEAISNTHTCAALLFVHWNASTRAGYSTLNATAGPQVRCPHDTWRAAAAVIMHL